MIGKCAFAIHHFFQVVEVLMYTHTLSIRWIAGRLPWLMTKLVVINPVACPDDQTKIQLQSKLLRWMILQKITR